MKNNGAYCRFQSSQFHNHQPSVQDDQSRPTASNIWRPWWRVILEGIHNLLIIKPALSKDLIYYGAVNQSRIKAYRLLAEEYNIDPSTVGQIFSKGAEWGLATLIDIGTHKQA